MFVSLPDVRLTQSAGLLQLYCVHSWLGNEAKAKEAYDRATQISLSYNQEYQVFFLSRTTVERLIGASLICVQLTEEARLGMEKCYAEKKCTLHYTGKKFMSQAWFVCVDCGCARILVSWKV
jgi:hypothetical protein